MAHIYFTNFSFMVLFAHYVGTLMLVFVILLFAFALLLLFVYYKQKTKHTQKAYECEKTITALSHEVSILQMTQISDGATLLTDAFKDLSVTHHQYKYVVPTLLRLQQNLVADFEVFIKDNDENAKHRLQDLMAQTQTLTKSITQHFASDLFFEEVKQLNLPASWETLGCLLEELLHRAHEHGVYLSLYNQVKRWTYYDLDLFAFVRLISNLVDNAVKETKKLPEKNRGEVRLTFKEVDDYLVVEITDAASEFPLDILKKLGQIGNSTNGSGFGYAEIMKDLKILDASFIIKEWQHETSSGTTISVLFDGYNMRFIDSHYRHKQLKNVLAATAFTLIDGFNA